MALFRSLFRGREDVFARRWYSRASDKSGYQPVCLNKWNRAFYDKKKFKCAECEVDFQVLRPFISESGLSPKGGGLGNLVALPLPEQARKLGNSVFANEDFVAFKDQWSYLHQVDKVSEKEVVVTGHYIQSIFSGNNYLFPLVEDITQAKPFRIYLCNENRIEKAFSIRNRLEGSHAVRSASGCVREKQD